MLPREFYERDATEVAPALLGKVLAHRTAEGTAAGVIVETEAYAGPWDKGAHSYGGKKTARTAIQYGPGGFAYVYLIYGMYCCFNAVVSLPEQPQCVLVRALRPVAGIDLMQKRRRTENLLDLCSGPGKLCAALGITRADNGGDLCGGALSIEDGELVPREKIGVSPRVNIDYAGECRDYLWRYYLRDDPFVSKVPGRYRSALTLDRL